MRGESTRISESTLPGPFAYVYYSRELYLKGSYLCRQSWNNIALELEQPCNSREIELLITILYYVAPECHI